MFVFIYVTFVLSKTYNRLWFLPILILLKIGLHMVWSVTSDVTCPHSLSQCKYHTMNENIYQLIFIILTASLKYKSFIFMFVLSLFIWGDFNIPPWKYVIIIIRYVCKVHIFSIYNQKNHIFIYISYYLPLYYFKKSILYF